MKRLYNLLLSTKNICENFSHFVTFSSKKSLMKLIKKSNFFVKSIVAERRYLKFKF